MTYGKSGIQQYQQMGAYSAAAYADPHQLVQVLMDAALDRMAQAKGAISRSSLVEKAESISKTMLIIDGLRASLDHSSGGDIAANLEALYNYMQQRLLQANIKNDLAALDEVASLLREIRGAWASIPQDVREAVRPPAGNGTTG